jgi:DNA-binding NarL/FixJ family response regulator
MPVHLYGQSCEMDGIMELAEQNGLLVIEDNAQAQGAACNSKQTGTRPRLPGISLIDMSMSQRDGYETAWWLKRNYPGIKILALSTYDNESSVIRMMKNGAKGYILKDIDPMEFRRALDSLMRKGFYYSELITGKLIHAVSQLDEPDEPVKCLVSLNAREIDFLKLVCTEMTYKEIAEKMFLSARTIDGYRDALFEKLNVKSRVGLVLYAIKNNIVNV